ncbi:c-type cytochrome [Sinimarinibacterium thermocellulolyticum]|uniref:C-type cytochrome n=1 Tax=Sinimarinibacterium thermocellulolyticum TaxID=3170016 RepID=A0ABV2A8T8_9GAMM
MKRVTVIAPIIALFAALPLAAAAAAPEKAAACAACHGEGGAKPILPEYPVLAGQYASYLEHSLREYRSGARKNAIMAAQAAALSDADIEALSRYFASQPGPLYTPGIGASHAPAP